MKTSQIPRTWVAGGEQALGVEIREPESREHQALHRSFRAEARELLQAMIRATLQIEQGGVSEQAIDAALQASHTLMGAAAVVGLPAVRARARSICDVLRPYRCAEPSVPTDVIARVTQLIHGMQEELGGTRQDPTSDLPAPGADERGGVIPIVTPR